jgi:hypothetical protein
MFAIHGSSETEEDMGTKSQSRIADYSMVGQVGEFPINSHSTLQSCHGESKDCILIDKLTIQTDILGFVRRPEPSSPHQRLYATAHTISRDTCGSLFVSGFTCGCCLVTMGTHKIYQAECTTTTLPDGRLGSASRTPSLTMAST